MEETNVAFLFFILPNDVVWIWSLFLHGSFSMVACSLMEEAPVLWRGVIGGGGQWGARVRNLIIWELSLHPPLLPWSWWLLLHGENLSRINSFPSLFRKRWSRTLLPDIVERWQQGLWIWLKDDSKDCELHLSSCKWFWLQFAGSNPPYREDPTVRNFSPPPAPINNSQEGRDWEWPS